jgi:hypothetical protein
MGWKCGGGSPGVLDKKMIYGISKDPAVVIYLLENQEAGSRCQVVADRMLEYRQLNSRRQEVRMVHKISRITPPKGRKQEKPRNMWEIKNRQVQGERLCEPVDGRDDGNDISKALVKKKAITKAVIHV